MKLNLKFQACKQYPAEPGEEGEHFQNGIQMYGEYQRIPRSCEATRRSGTRDLPNRRSLGAAKPQLCCYLSAIAWQKGTILLYLTFIL